jgi:hypothetical protein
MIGASMSEEIAEKQLSGGYVELKYAVYWLVCVTGYESSVGDQDDPPLEKHGELQASRLRNGS